MNDFSLVKAALTELYSNLSYITLSGARYSSFDAAAELTEEYFFYLKKEEIQKLRESEDSHAKNVYNTNKGRLFEDPLDTVIGILDVADIEHKK